MTVKQTLFQQILKEKWYIGSTEGIFSDCAFCYYTIKRSKDKIKYCPRCPIVNICGIHEGLIGQAYKNIIHYSRENTLFRINQLPDNLVQSLIDAIKTEL